MKKAIVAVLVLVSMVFLLPLGLALGASAQAGVAAAEASPSGGGSGTPAGSSPAVASGGSASSAPPEVSSAAPAETATGDSAVTLTVLLEGETRTLTLEEYLWGVVAAEMPASFELEALKAQAIAARTFTRYRMTHPKGSHEAALCGNSACCQAWISREKRLDNWSEDKREEYADKITAAIRETDGETALWEGEPILAVFHASSGGRTRNVSDVWGGSYPYLVSVESPEGADVPNYYSTVTVSVSDFRDKLLAAHADADLSGSPKDWLGEMRYDEGGLPLTMQVGGVTVTTKELRTLFSLRSPTLTAEANEEEVTFFVTGYGHGVGLSQYGANALAKEGKTAEEIIRWYYTGVTVGAV